MRNCIYFFNKDSEFLIRRHYNTVHRQDKNQGPFELDKNGRKIVRCPQCDYTTYANSLLSRHLNSVHLKLRPFSCPECDYSAPSTSYLKVPY